MSQSDSAVRPLGEILENEEECVPCGQNNEQEVTLEEHAGQESRIIRGQSRIIQPTQQEFDDHMRTHIPYRKWCTQCVEGKRNSGGISTQQDEIKENEEVPRIAFDYMKQKSKEVGEEEKKERKEKWKTGGTEEEGEEEYLPTLVSFETGIK